MPDTITMAALDAMPQPEFLATLGDLFEHSPWVAEAVAGQRPFGTARRLHKAAMLAVHGASMEAQVGLLRAHPELAGREASAGTLTEDSTSEQERLGFTRLSAAEHAELGALNTAYRDRFGWPAIVALARHAQRETVVAAIRTRAAAAPEAERTASLSEVGHIAEGRLAARLGRARGAVSLHALDTVKGGGAEGLAYTLSRREGAVWHLLCEGRTDAHGRTPGGLVSGLDVEPGEYRIEYLVGAYHRALGRGADMPFLDVVPIAFGVADPGAHYHVPLQFTPWSYATYRGS